MYPGGKGGVYQKIINQIPPHTVYVEPFLGGGAVMKNKRPARVNIGIEKDPAVIGNTAKEIAPGAEIAQGDAAAAALFVAMDAATLRSGGAGRHLVPPPDLPGPAHYFVCGDGLQFLTAYPWNGTEFVYCDPPYIIGLRASRRAIYEYEFTQAQHVELLEVARALPCNVMISGYEGGLYNSALHEWRTYQYDAQTRGGTCAREWLWMNYEEPEQLHDYQYLGEDYRERERIKRKKDRWVNRLKTLDPLERKAILWAIREAGIV